MNADGTNIRRITNNRVWDSFPNWSARGDMLVFTSAIDDNQYQLMLDQDPFGYTRSDPQPIGSSPPFSSKLVWLPDGRILFLGNFDGEKLLYLTDFPGIRDHHEQVTNFTDMVSFDWWQRTQ